MTDKRSQNNLFH